MRKYLGYSHIPASLAGAVNAFRQRLFSPNLNYHQPCYFPTKACDAERRVRKYYRQHLFQTISESLTTAA